MSKLLKSFLGSFAARSGLSLVEFVGIVYVATVGGATTLGAYALFRAVFVVVALCLDLGTKEATIKRIAEQESQGEFLAASILTKTALLVPVVVAILVFRGAVTNYVGSPLAAPFLVGLSVLDVFTKAIYAGLHGEQRVGRAELSLFVNVAGKVVVWVGLLSLGYGLAGLLVGLVVGKGLQILVGLRFLSIRPRMPASDHFRSLFAFGRYSWLGALRERAWIWTDTLVLGFFVPANLVGVYELSWRLSAAFFLVSSAISSTLFANVDRLDRQQGREAVRAAIEESLVYTGIVALPGLVGGLVIAKSLLSAFGPAYVVGYVALVVLIVARLAHSYEIVFAKVLNALDRPDLTFRADAVFVTLNVVGNVLAILALGWVGAAVATTVSMGVRTMLSYRYLHALVDVPIPRREIVLEALAALLMGAAILFVTRGDQLTELETALAIGGGALCYATLVVALVGRVRTRVRSLVTRFV